MPNYIEIQVPVPCHQNWDSMQADKTGRFCNSCQKSVVDFTNMSDEQLVHFFKQDRGKVCGRLLDGQLERAMSIPAQKIPWLSYLIRITIPAFLFTYKASAQRQLINHQAVVVLPGSKPVQPPVTGEASRLISGRITGNDGKPVAWVSVMIAGSHRGVVADSSGRFLIRLEGVERVLEFSALGYESRRLTISSGITEVDILMNEISQPVLVGEVVTVKSRRLKKKKNTVPASAVKTGNTISLFPNPAKSLTAFTIRWKEPVSANQEVSIYSIAGILALKQTLQINTVTREIQLTPGILTAGNYIVHVMDSKTRQVIVSQIIIE